jgi:hypothetical protein
MPKLSSLSSRLAQPHWRRSFRFVFYLAVGSPAHHAGCKIDPVPLQRQDCAGSAASVDAEKDEALEVLGAPSFTPQGQAVVVYRRKRLALSSPE